jgi:predicted molibdopterin-dependent oxidoreductase YjgC
VDTLARLASAFDGSQERPISPAGALRAVLPLLTRFSLGRGRLAVGLRSQAEPLHAGELARRVARPSGRIDLAPRDFVTGLSETLGAGAGVQEGELVLSTCNRSPQFINGKTRILGRAADRAVVHLAPVDAERRGLSDGSRVVIETFTGKLEAEVLVDETLRPGAAAMLFGTTGLNRITDGADRDPLSGIPALANVPCRIEKQEAVT